MRDRTDRSDLTYRCSRPPGVVEAIAAAGRHWPNPSEPGTVNALMVLGLVSLLSAVAPVNDANWVSFGGAGAFVPHKTVRMLGEDINITIYDDRIHVRVWFSFRNDGPATAVKMAFPFSDTVFSMEPIVKRFSSKVDGEAVAVVKERIEPFTKDGKDFKKLDYDIAQPFAYVKEVAFEQGQRRTVLVDYVTSLGRVFGGNIAEYVLHTGATWAGKIGMCTITVDWSNVKLSNGPFLKFYREDLSEFKSPWTYISPTKATTTITDFEPDFDLSLSSAIKDLDYERDGGSPSWATSPPV